ncbi:hypothetical protein AWW66_23635 [Micromonospora rosaria]|uniref:HTH cro/C1-type domain-containing protein n=2 Tax=Micromonospora rosaria TaxID=47874 RepID=A0A136PML6_9ACTN|nr:hypothetical protein AWW66_23635 [Micromonospora rosaria]
MREKQGRTLDDVRKEVEWSFSKLIRIESGVVSVSVSDLKSLLHVYGVTDPQLVEEMTELARRSRRRHWASEYRDVATSAYMDFLGYEDDARSIVQYHPMVIPGLLQTEDYARCVIEATTVGPVDTSVVEGRVRLRMARQERLFRESRECNVRFIIDEGVLSRSVEPSGVMKDQLRHLIDMSEKPQVSILILPIAARVVRRFIGPFSLHEFQSERDSDVVYLDSAPHDVALVEDAQVESYKVIIGELADACYSEARSRERLREQALLESG